MDIQKIHKDHLTSLTFFQIMLNIDDYRRYKGIKNFLNKPPLKAPERVLDFNLLAAYILRATERTSAQT